MHNVIIMCKETSKIYARVHNVVKNDQTLPVYIAEVMKVIQTLDHISEDDSNHFLLEAITKWLSRVHDVSTRT